MQRNGRAVRCEPKYAPSSTSIGNLGQERNKEKTDAPAKKAEANKIRRPRGERGLAPEKDVCTYARDMLHHGVSAPVCLEGLAVLKLR